MKKIAVSIIAITLLLAMVSCNFVLPNVKNTDTTDTKDTTNTTQSTVSTTQTTDKGGIDPVPDNDIIADVDVSGSNEMIYLSFVTNDDYTYEISYAVSEEEDYLLLDKELMIANGNTLNCYILGLKADTYSVKIDAYEKSSNTKSGIKLSNVIVSAQDRTGYAHFGATNGIGAYNNDGTLKEGTKIVYVTNENKNTVTLEINGETYTGLVNILQAQYRSSTPLLIRIIGKISTNQWNYKNVEPRLSDGSNSTEDFFVNTFSTEYGENLANLVVKFSDKGEGATHNYRTTPEGLTDVRITGSSTSTTTYKGSDFPSLKNKTVYDDDSYYNMLEVSGASNITIEGIGSDAEIFQFGIGFEKCNNIEIKNLTFTAYPEDALNFLNGDRSTLADYNRYWIHNCTFNRGYNAWDVSGERDKYAGDGSIDFNNISNVTLSYNEFNNSKKSMLVANGDSNACMNFTMHHNHFNGVESRLPLSRGSNIHSFNNYFNGCKTCTSARVNTYMFSEYNYYSSCSTPFSLSSSTVKSFGDIFASSNKGSINVVTDRAAIVSNSCKPDKSTDYSKFDTDSTLFYYDSVNKRTMASIMVEAEDVPDFVLKYAGAGKSAILPLTDDDAYNAEIIKDFGVIDSGN